MLTRSIDKVLFTVAVTMVLLALLGQVTVAQTNNGTTSADFLTIGVGARPAGLGGAYTALAEGASSAHWNPAGVAHIESGQAVFSHFAWYQDLALDHISVSFPFGDRGGMAIGLTYLNYGTIEDLDANGNSVGQLSAYDWSASVSLGLAVNDQFALGVTGKVINERLDVYSATGFAGDLGFSYRQDRFSLAGVLANVGTGLTFDQVKEDLPSLLRIGAAFRPVSDRLVLGTELEHRLDGGSILRQGVELSFSDQYFIRSGVHYVPGQADWGIGDGLAFGAGLKFSQLRIDYAFSPSTTFVNDDLHRFSLTFDFSK